ncbi:MAG: 50S ribosomal protein L21 [Spirochaetes bacterium]|nr:50S ribosomal protein L21 [Spirochaetota bacterium]
MYSIVEINSKQYRLEEGKPALVDRIEAKKDEEIKIDKVLLLRDDKEGVKIGKPYLKGVAIQAKVLGNVKGKKLRVFKYKRRKDYRRTIGSRPEYTRIVVEKMERGT